MSAVSFRESDVQNGRPSTSQFSTQRDRQSATHADTQTQSIQNDLRGLLALDRPFELACIQSAHGRNVVADLIAQRYSWRGYSINSHALFRSDGNQMTFVAYHDASVIGTLTLGLDSSRGLDADELYKDEIDWHRRQSARCCELTRFALAPSVHSKEVFASLFHLSFIFGRLIHRVTDVFIEVNPRHASFYERMLGLEQLGSERICTRVDAPAVLLRGDLNYIEEQIREHGGSAYKKGQSLYTYFFSAEEEQNILQQLRRLQ